MTDPTEADLVREPVDQARGAVDEEATLRELYGEPDADGVYRADDESEER